MRRLLLGIVACLALAAPAQAAISVTVTPVCANHSGSSVSITLGSTPSAGDTVIYVAYSFDNGRTLSSVVDGNAGDASAVIGSDLNTGSPTFTRLQVAGFRVTTGSTAITATYSGSLIGTRGCAFAVSGAANPVAFNTAISGTSATTTTHTSGNITTTVADSMLVGVVMVTGAGTPAVPASWTSGDGTADGRFDYRILSATNTLAYTPTTAGNASGNIMITALQGTAGGGGGTAARGSLIGVLP